MKQMSQCCDEATREDGDVCTTEAIKDDGELDCEEAVRVENIGKCWDLHVKCPRGKDSKSKYIFYMWVQSGSRLQQKQGSTRNLFYFAFQKELLQLQGILKALARRSGLMAGSDPNSALIAIVMTPGFWLLKAARATARKPRSMIVGERT
ncbi:hypothetical protein POUND7_000528 [Theobroma cacao]